jgi:hypothetical protein
MVKLATKFASIRQFLAVEKRNHANLNISSVYLGFFLKNRVVEKATPSD